jgi:5-hydroxyisourate hydrolase-like protein (transthyretin family)
MASRSPITSHVLDATTGRPAVGVAVSLYKLADADALTFTHLADGWDRNTFETSE